MQARSIKEVLNQPYPFFHNRWKLIIFISLFVTLFMLVFEPFGLSNYKDANKTLIISGYGLVTFVILVFNLILIPFFFKKVFSVTTWTVIKQITWLLWIIFTIGLGNYLYTSIVFSFFSGLYGILLFQFYTLSIGIIPIVFITILHQNILLSKNLTKAAELNSQLKPNHPEGSENEMITLSAGNHNNEIRFQLKDLLYIESVGNYIQVYVAKDGEVNKTLLRNTLSAAEKQLDNYPSIVKCHRAFIVNLVQIDKLKGNSQGLKLLLKKSDTEIPVSRSFSKQLKERIQSFYH